MQRFAYTVVTWRRPVGTMHRPAWDGIELPADATEADMLARAGNDGMELVSVVANSHDTERRFYFKAAT